MNIIASQSIVFWEQLQILIDSRVRNCDVDPYIFKSLKENTQRLESSIYKAIGLGLWNVFVPSNKKYSVTLHVAFMQSLINNSSLETNSVDDWMADHLLMGVIRLLEMCEHYDGVATELRSSLKNNLNKTGKSMRFRAWVYLEEIAQTQ